MYMYVCIYIYAVVYVCMYLYTHTEYPHTQCHPSLPFLMILMFGACDLEVVQSLGHPETRNLPQFGSTPQVPLDGTQTPGRI